MSTALIALAALVAASWLVYRMVVVVRADGLGYRPIPRSHHDEEVSRQSVLSR